MKKNKITPFLEIIFDKYSESASFDFDNIASKLSKETHSYFTIFLSILGAFAANFFFILWFVLFYGKIDPVIILSISIISIVTTSLIVPWKTEKKKNKLMLEVYQTIFLASSYGLLIYGLSEIEELRDNIELIMIAIQIPIILLSKSKLQKFISIGIAYIFAQTFFMENHLYNLFSLPVTISLGISLYLLKFESKIISSKKFLAQYYSSFQYANVLALLCMMVFIANFKLLETDEFLWYLSPTVVLMGILLVIDDIIKKISISVDKKLVLFVSSIILVPLIFAPGIITSILILLIGVGYGYRIYTGIGIASLVYTVSNFYFFLDISLLNKSYIMFGTGLLLLASYALLNREKKA